MFQRQRDVPFEFETANPSDVEGWIEIIESPPCKPESSAAGKPRGNADAPSRDDECQQVHHLRHSKRQETKSQLRLSSIPGPSRAPSITFSEPTISDQTDSLRSDFPQTPEAFANMIDISNAISRVRSPNAGLEHREAPLQVIDDLILGRDAEAFLTGFRSEMREGAVAALLTHPLSVNGLTVEEGSDDDDDASSDVSDSSSDMPAPVSVLHRCARKVNVLRERISELGFTLEERIANSDSTPEAKSAQLDDIDVSKMGALQAALSKANERESSQRALCLEQGIDPEQFRYRHISVSNAS